MTRKKATELENIIIRIGVKLILLFNNKDISVSEFSKCLPLTQQIWSDVIDFSEMSFSYNPDSFQNSVTQLEEVLKELIRPFVTDKTINKLTYLFNYFKDRDFLDALYLNEQNKGIKLKIAEALRSEWDKVFDKEKS